MKTFHHAVHVTSTEAELFTIRYGINQSLNINSISKIVVITNFIHAVKKIFDPSVYPYQTQLVAILSDLHKFFDCSKTNFIEFWECPSCLKQRLYNDVDKETKTVVATTCQNGTCDMLTLAELLVGYLVVEITRKLNKEPLLYCSSIYINTMWSMLQQYLPALKAMCPPHVLLLIHHKTTMPYTYALTSYS